MGTRDHTRGPWTIQATSMEQPIIYITGDTGHTEVAVLYRDADREANARLIAAAPDLLAALRSWCDAHEATEFVCGGLTADYLRSRALLAWIDGRIGQEPAR